MWLVAILLDSTGLEIQIRSLRVTDTRHASGQGKAGYHMLRADINIPEQEPSFNNYFFSPYEVWGTEDIGINNPEGSLM